MARRSRATTKQSPHTSRDCFGLTPRNDISYRGNHGLEKSNYSHHGWNRFLRQEVYKDRARGKAAEEDHHLQPRRAETARNEDARIRPSIVALFHRRRAR